MTSWGSAPLGVRSRGATGLIGAVQQKRPRAQAAAARRPVPDNSSDWDRAVLVALGLAGLLLAVLARHHWFWYDEWEFFARRSDASPVDLLVPHNEHLTALPLLSYRIVFAVFGMHSHLPYYLVLVAVLLVTLHLLYRTLRVSKVPAPPAAALVLVLAVLAAGAQNLLWAWQIGLLGSLAFFFAATRTLIASPGPGSDRRVSALLVGSLLCSGIGVSAAAAVAAGVAAQRRSLRAACRVVAVPALLYVVWFAVFGRTGVGSGESDLAESLALTPAFVYTGVAAAASGVVSLPQEQVGPALVVLIVLCVVAVLVRRGTLPLATIVGGAGALAFLGSSAVLRAGHHGLAMASAGRYVHVVAAMGVLALAPLAFAAAADAAVLQRVARATVSAAAVVGLLNVGGLVQAAADEAEVEQAVRARVEASALLLRSGDVPVLPQAQPHGVYAPALTVTRLRRLLAGGHIDVPSKASVQPQELLAAMAAVQTSVDALPAGGLDAPVYLQAVDGSEGLRDLGSGCAQLPPGIAGRPGATFQYVTGGDFSLSSDREQVVRVYQGQTPEFAVSAYRDVRLEPGVSMRFSVAAPSGARAYVRPDLPAGGAATLCGRPA